MPDASSRAAGSARSRRRSGTRSHRSIRSAASAPTRVSVDRDQPPALGAAVPPPFRRATRDDLRRSVVSAQLLLAATPGAARARPSAARGAAPGRRLPRLAAERHDVGVDAAVELAQRRALDRETGLGDHTAQDLRSAVVTANSCTPPGGRRGEVARFEGPRQPTVSSATAAIPVPLLTVRRTVASSSVPDSNSYDAIVVGGGHNGLVAAAYLAQRGPAHRGARAPAVVGGAAVSEHPFGPDYTVTSLSYVVSLLPPALSATCGSSGTATTCTRRARTSPRADGSYLQLPNDPLAGASRSRSSRRKDADAIEALGRLARRPRPGARPAAARRSRPGRVAAPADLLARRRCLAAPRARRARPVDITRLLTRAIADLVEEYFESDAMRGVLSVSGVIGTWAGPRSPGTAYVMLHHHIGDVGDGAARRVGVPARRHGRRDRRRMAVGRPIVRRRDPHRRAGRADRPSTAARSTGVMLASGRGAARADRRHDRAPADLVPAPARPPRPARGLRRATSSGGRPAAAR